jgi:1-acyl-sn-glycerol-3-phosphate acyltransferase
VSAIHDGKATRARPLRDDRSAFVRLTHATGRVLLRCLTRVRIRGLGADLPATGPLIIACNHLSNADPIVVGSYVSPALGRNLHWLGKEEALRIPIFGWAMAENGVFGIRRGAADIEAFRLAKRILDEGHVLVVFPEGTRSRTGGLAEAKDGIAILALRTGAPILPVGVSGTDRFWPIGSRRFHPGGAIALHVGTPFTLPEPVPGADRRAAQHAATEEIMRRIAELLPPANRGVYAGLVEAGDPADR